MDLSTCLINGRYNRHYFLLRMGCQYYFVHPGLDAKTFWNYLARQSHVEDTQWQSHFWRIPMIDFPVSSRWVSVNRTPKLLNLVAWCGLSVLKSEVASLFFTFLGDTFIHSFIHSSNIYWVPITWQALFKIRRIPQWMKPVSVLKRQKV